MELTDRIFDENGNAFLSSDAIANMLYNGKDIFAGNFYVDTSDGEMENSICILMRRLNLLLQKELIITNVEMSGLCRIFIKHLILTSCLIL